MTTQHILSVQVLNDYIEENSILGGYKVRNAAGIAHVYRVADPTVRALALEAWQVHVAPVDIACAGARYYPHRSVVAAVLDCVEQTADSLSAFIAPPSPAPRRRARGRVRPAVTSDALEERCRSLRAQVRAWSVSSSLGSSAVDRERESVEVLKNALGRCGKEVDNAVLAHTYLGRLCAVSPSIEALENTVHIATSAVRHALVARRERTRSRDDPSVTLSDLLRRHFPTPSLGTPA